ncbi:MAG: N-acetylmuramoyl-L-alanine amidase [Neolewinella sp.]|jgi:N-acetylmuramoyl-L-alanine amidase
MMPKGNNALVFLLLLLMNGSLLTASIPLTSSITDGFNDSLREWVRKSTPCTNNELKKVVIDAGHGGKDPGGMGDNSMEKHITLSIARLLAIGIRTNYPDVEVIMTRSDDTFIPLYKRADIANKTGADLFISIHANIMPGSKATYGTETFVMGQHVAEQNLRVAKRENASILLEGGDVTANYGYDPSSTEGHIMLSMVQHAFLDRSILFAEAVESEFKAAGRKSRGVKQAGFVVLKATTMPAVLVETGFMSNPNEESFLLSDAGQQKQATSLLNAFGKYYMAVSGNRNAPVAATSPIPRVIAYYVTAPTSQVRTVKSSNGPAWVPDTPRPAVYVPRSTTTTTIFAKEVDLSPTTQRQWTAKGVSPEPLTYNTALPAAPTPNSGYSRPTPAGGIPLTPATPSVLSTSRSVGVTYSSVLAKEVELAFTRSGNRVIPGTTGNLYTYAPPISQPDSSIDGKYKFGEAARRKEDSRPKGIDLSKISDTELLYAVQIIASKRDLDLSIPEFQRVPYPILKVQEGGWNKYQVRQLPTATAAKQARSRIKKSGFNEAMIVVYMNGKRLTPSSVNYLLER